MTEEEIKQTIKSSGCDLSIYGGTEFEQAAGLRYELEHEKLEQHQDAMSESFNANFGE